MKKEVKYRTDVINSSSFSQILFLIASGKNYAQAIAKERGTEPSPTVKQLNELRKRGYLLKPKHEPLLNKKIYFVQWERISKDFFIYLKHKNPSIKINHKLISNKYFLKFFEELLANFSRTKKPTTISNIFDKLLSEGIPMRSQVEAEDFMGQVKGGYEPPPPTKEDIIWGDFRDINSIIEKIRESNAEIIEFKDLSQKIVDKLYEEYKAKKEASDNQNG